MNLPCNFLNGLFPVESVYKGRKYLIKKNHTILFFQLLSFYMTDVFFNELNKNWLKMCTDILMIVGINIPRNISLLGKRTKAIAQ